ncbi:MAG: MFS transporter [Hyphomicrobium sp.]|nr:MAG: MFS transporter [Hyphomicrobium sp.]
MAGDGSGREAAQTGMPPGEAGSFALRLSVFFAALFLIYGVHLPYLPVWLDWRGITPSEIGVITSAPFFVRLVVTPAVALYADQWNAHRGFIIALAWSATAAGVMLAVAPGFWPVLLSAVVFALAITSIMPLTETIAVGGVRAGGLDYGRMRLWGSLAFVAATFLGGAVIERAGAGAGVWMMVAAAVLTVVAAHALPLPASGGGGPQGSKRWPDTAVAKRLMRSSVFLAFLVAVGAIQGAHATFYTFGALHWQSQGIAPAMVGALWTIGVVAEIALFAYSRWVMQRIWATTLLILGAVSAVVRWSIMAWDPPLSLLFPLQVLHGATYGATHLGAIHFINRAIPENATGTAQAIYATVAAGIAMGLATLIAGALFARSGALAYVAMAALAFLGLLASLYVRRSWAGFRLWD